MIHAKHIGFVYEIRWDSEQEHQIALDSICGALCPKHKPGINPFDTHHKHCTVFSNGVAVRLYTPKNSRSEQAVLDLLME
jgi:hypothetical protein